VGLGELARLQVSVDLVRQIADLAMELGQDIRAQQTLLDAETGRLKTNPTAQTCLGVLARLEEQLSRHRGRLSIRSLNPESVLRCDHQLLSRVLLNMATNALEAARPTEVVSVRHEVRDGAHVFAVHNEEPISTEVSSRIFHRTVSTKASSGRGLGTYSMKLLGEQYLGGKLWFESSEALGTTFYFSVPEV
jgi:signal transduction histidine kinase